MNFLNECLIHGSNLCRTFSSLYISVRGVEDEAIENEIEPFTQTVAAFIKLCEKETSLMKKVLPDQYFKKVFDLIVNIPLDGLRQDAKRFAQHIKECQLRKGRVSRDSCSHLTKSRAF